MSQRGGYGEGRGQPEPFRGGDVGGRGQPGPFRVGGRDGRGGSGRGRGRDRGSDSSNPNPSSSSSYYRPAPPSTHQVRSTSSSSSSSYRSAPPPLSRPRSSSSSTYEVVSTSSSSVAIVDETLTAQVQNKLNLETSSSSVAIRVPPARPGFGTVGRKCIVKANHFLVSLQENEFHHYDVSITPEVISRRVNRAVMTQLVENYCNSHLGNSKPVYDGRKGLFTAGPLPFESKEFIVKLAQDEEPSYSAKREREFKVAIKLVARTNVRHLLEFLSGRQMDAPMDIIQTMDIVLRQTPTKDSTPVGRSFFSVKFGRSEVGDGVECWKGFYQSLRPTQMGLSLNIDVAATSFHEAILVIDYVKKLLNLRDPSRPLSDMDRTKIKKALRGLRVELTHTRVARQLKIAGITSHPLNQLTFTADASGQKMTVSQYFYEKYQIRLQFAHWPALQAGTDSKPIYLPFEVCKIIQGQRYSKKLNEKQVTAILRAACQRPDLREQNIYEIAEKNNYKDDEYAQQFGIDVAPRLTTIQEARILQAPMLKYHDTGREVTIQPRIGQWNMINAKMVDGATVRHWTCVNFSSHLRLDAVFHFVQDLIAMCASKGMNCNPQPLIPIDSGHADRIEDTLVDIHSQATARLESLGVQGQLQLLIIILPEFSGTYGTIKRICETELGIISQCCKPKNVLKNSKQYHENVALKINVKAGGRNTVLADALHRRIPLVTDKPTIIFGADVTHPNPGEDSSPSIAAVVASMDWPEITKYRALVSAQKRDEIIKDLSEMVRVLLKAFYQSTGGMKPSRIIFYRDGVGEGQFSEVLLKEVDAIYEKRHHTRLFPADHGNRNLTDRSGNILPGTVVDTQICHPSQFDFYLCSHAGIQGTSRPTHYHVLWDENNFTADTMQTLTNNLCYTYARCTRSVSVVPPAYYAHLAAFRARYYIEDDASESGSSPVTAGRDGEIRPLPKIKDNVRDVMFYC